MQNNWYAVYTKPHCERKVNSLLTKRNIEAYCPLNLKKNRQIFRDTIIREPLFTSYVFVRTSETEIFKLCKEINGIINLFYWKGKPAIIKDEEINAIMDFTKYHQEISVEKMHLISSTDDSGVSYYLDGQILFVKNRTMKLTLPSLRYTMVAKYKEEGVMGREISFGNKELIGQS